MSSYGNTLVWMGKSLEGLAKRVSLDDQSLDIGPLRVAKLLQRLAQRVHDAPHAFIKNDEQSHKAEEVRFCALKKNAGIASTPTEKEGEETDPPVGHIANDAFSSLVLGVPNLRRFQWMKLPGIMIPEDIVSMFSEVPSSKLCMVEVLFEKTQSADGETDKCNGSPRALEGLLNRVSFTHVVYFSSIAGFVKQLESVDLRTVLGEEWEDVAFLYQTWRIPTTPAFLDIKWKLLRWCYIAGPYYALSRSTTDTPDSFVIRPARSPPSRTSTSSAGLKPPRVRPVLFEQAMLSRGYRPHTNNASYQRLLRLPPAASQTSTTTTTTTRKRKHTRPIEATLLLDTDDDDDDDALRVKEAAQKKSKRKDTSMTTRSQTKQKTNEPLFGIAKADSKSTHAIGDVASIYRKVEERNIGIDEKQNLVIVCGWDECLDAPRYSDLQYKLSEEMLAEHALGMPIFAMDLDSSKKKCFLLATYPQIWDIMQNWAGATTRTTGGSVGIKSHTLLSNFGYSKLALGGATPSFLSSSSHCVHSVVKETDCCKGFWDFEMKFDEPQSLCFIEHMGDVMTAAMLDLIVEVMEEVCAVTLDYSDFCIFDASKDTKISRHVVMATPGVFFYNLGHFQRLVRILEAVLIKKVTSGSVEEKKKYSVLFWAKLRKPPVRSPSSRTGVSVRSLTPSRAAASMHPIETIAEYVGMFDTTRDESVASMYECRCFWDIGASLGKTKFFRTPFSTNYGEERYLLPARMNTFEPQKAFIEPLVSKELLRSMTRKELMFYFGLPTAVMKHQIDSRSFEEIALRLSSSLEQMHLKDSVVNTPEKFNFYSHDPLGRKMEERIATVQLRGFVRQLDSTMQSIQMKNDALASAMHGPAYESKLNRYVSQTAYSTPFRACNSHATNEALRRLFARLPDTEGWSAVTRFTIATESKADNVVHKIKVKVPTSRWCPILVGHHSKRQGNATATLYSNSGTIVFHCWSTKCASKALPKKFTPSDLAELFRSINS